MERRHDRVEVRLLGIGGLDRGLDLGVHPSDDRLGPEPLDDRDAVVLDCIADGHGIRGCGEAGDDGSHVPSVGQADVEPDEKTSSPRL